MKWDDTVNAGFSLAPAEKLYLPVTKDGKSVKAGAEQEDSLYNTVRKVLKIRNSHKEFEAGADFEVLLAEKAKPFVFARGKMIVAVNPSADTANVTLSPAAGSSLASTFGSKQVFEIVDAQFTGISLVMGPQSFAIFE